MIKGKSAIVTGSTSGIGLGIATALAEQGCNLLLNGFGDKAEIEKLRAGLAEKHRVKVVYSPADMSKPADIRAMVALAEKELGACDILVNNAGIQFVAPIEDFPEEKWDAIGRIVNIASAHGLVASGGKVAYVSAKHGLVGMTKVVAIDHANDGITCNAICPGWVLTPLVQKQIEDHAKQEGISVDKAKENLLKEKQPMLQFSTPEHLGALTVYLCSDAAATITGTTVSMDGGWTAQ